MGEGLVSESPFLLPFSHANGRRGWGMRAFAYITYHNLHDGVLVRIYHL